MARRWDILATVSTPGILAVNLGPVRLKNPVMTASGTCGYGHDVQPAGLNASLGAICTKGLSLEPRQGNPPPRIWETPAGMLNAIGLANMGVEAFLADVLPLLEQAGVTVIANIFADSMEDFGRLAARLAKAGGIAALELNVSCPNVKQGGIHFGRDPDRAAELTAHVSERSGLPIIVKMTPEAPDIAAVARACEQAGACALSAINTIRGMAVDVERARPRLATVYGGLSGPALKPIALRIVHELSKQVSIPIVGIGGISSAEDALEFLMAGASAVQVGTATFLDPQAPFQVLAGLETWCTEHETTIRKVIGSMEEP
ncbi:MAG: dihydroorotate dehydrogenase [Deltaproteobacteria bacterium]|nr:dihydroorotate dehydrogenase [Deltaproteobacteria bacterium]